MITNKPYLHLEKTESGYRLDVVFTLPSGVDVLPVLDETVGINKVLTFPVVEVEGQMHFGFKDYVFHFSGLNPSAYIDVQLVEVSAIGGLSEDGSLGVTRVFLSAADGEEDREGDTNQGGTGGEGGN
ncbi:MAG: hypothetical protein R3D00_02975 [Bacteroidia bacterium]